MSQKKLELISLLTEAYRGDLLPVVSACIQGFDFPISIRNKNFDSHTANAAYLDLFKRTPTQHRASTIIDGFTPCDRASGQAVAYLTQFKVILKTGNGCVLFRTWNGREATPMCVYGKIIGPWVLSGFETPGSLQVVRPAEYQGFPRIVGNTHTG